MTDASTPMTRAVDGVSLPTAGVFALDPAHTQFGFTARHLMVSKVRGHFGEFSGTVTVADEITDSVVEITIQAASISTNDPNRDAHVRSDDFLGADQYPTLKFVSTSIEHKSGAKYVVTGDFTVRDVTRPLALDVEFEGLIQDPWGNQRLGFSASGEIDREEFGVKFNAALETGGVVVGPKVRLDVDAEAVRQA